MKKLLIIILIGFGFYQWSVDKNNSLVTYKDHNQSVSYQNNNTIKISDQQKLHLCDFQVEMYV